MKDFHIEIHGETYTIPGHMFEGLRRYIDEGIIPGSFLTAVLENDLHNAFSYADSHNFRNIPAYIYYLYNDAPFSCWGSPERVKKWAAQFKF